MVDITPPNRRGARTGTVQRPAFLEETGLDLTDRSSPEVRELTQMLGGAEPIDEIPVESDSLDEADQIEAAIVALRNDAGTIGRPVGDDAEADAAVSQILRSTARDGNNQQRSHLSVVAAIRAEQEAEDADIEDDDQSGMGLDLREKTEEEIAAIGRLSPQARQAVEKGKDQHVVRQAKPERTGGGRQAAKLYPDKPVAPVNKEPIREPEPEPEEESEPDVDELIAEAEPEVVFVPAKKVEPKQIAKPVPPLMADIGPPKSEPTPRVQSSAERRLAREAGAPTKAKVEQQKQVAGTESLKSLLDQIEADEELPEEELPEPEPAPQPQISMLIPRATDRPLFTTTIAKFERTLTQTYGGTNIEIWQSGNVTVNGKPTGPQLRAMILGELFLKEAK